MSEHDLRVLSEIEHDLELIDLGRRRHLPERGLLFAASGVFVGTALIALGLWTTATLGTVAAVTGFVLIVWASHQVASHTTPMPSYGP
jgi:hypothetical protein